MTNHPSKPLFDSSESESQTPNISQKGEITMSMKRILKKAARTTKQKAHIERLSEAEAEKLIRKLTNKEEPKK